MQEKEQSLSLGHRILNKLFGNRVIQSYLRIPRKYRWVGSAAISTALFGSGAGLLAAGAYFGLKLQKYLLGGLTSAGAVKATELFEDYYGTKLGRELDRIIAQNLETKELVKEKSEHQAMEIPNLDKLINRTDQQLRKIAKFRKRMNYAKAVAGVAGFLVGYESSDIAGIGGSETFGITHPEIVRPGDSIWKVAERAASHNLGGQWDHLDIAQKHYFIDFLKDKVVNNPEKFGLHHLTGMDPSLVHPGDKIDFSSVLNNSGLVKDVLDKAQHLTFYDKAHIITNIDWEKHLPAGYKIKFVDVGNDGVPDEAILSSKGTIVEKIPFRGTGRNLDQIYQFTENIKEQIAVLDTYPKEILDDPTILKDIVNNPEILSNLRDLADISEVNLNHSLVIYKDIGGHLELLKTTDGSWNLDQIKIVMHLHNEVGNISPDKVESVQNALSLSKNLIGSIKNKIAWAKLRFDPVQFKDAVKIIDSDIDPSKIIDAKTHWDGNALVLRINRLFWFDKTITLHPPIAPKTPGIAI